VSKRWCALISDPTFVDAHKKLHNEPLIISSSGKKPNARPGLLQLMDMKGNVVKVTKFVGGMGLLSSSSDDLICILGDDHPGVRLIDPVTGTVVEGSGQLLETHYNNNNNNIGLGYGRAVPSGVYKLVHLEGDLTCKVITLGEDTTWRRTESPPTHSCYNQHYPVVVNGVMYCLVAVAPSAVDHSLLCFDLESEQWIKMIDSPRKVSGGGDGLWKLTWILPIVELNGALCMVQKETDMTSNSCIHIWLLTDFDNETWNKEYTIPMPSNASDYMPLWMAGFFFRNGSKNAPASASK
jgi:F-box interacting protein